MGTVVTMCNIHREFSATLTRSARSIQDSNASEKGGE